MTHSTEALRELAPGGTLRAGINLGNPVIAPTDAAGVPRGIGPGLARELANRLGVPVTLVTYPTAGKLADAVRDAAWDVAFLAIDPERAVDIAFTDAYAHIEGTYMVRDDSPLQRIDVVDQPGVRIAVGAKTAYDLYLTRHVRNAELVRAASSRAAVDMFLRDGLEVVAGVKQPLVAEARGVAGLRVMEGSFMVIRQAAGVPRHNSAAHAYVTAFIEEAKRSGLAARLLADSGVDGAEIAPLT